jgi:hypothetical protein
MMELEKGGDILYFALFEVRATTPVTKLPPGYMTPAPPQSDRFPSVTLKSTSPVANTPAVSLFPPAEPAAAETEEISAFRAPTQEAFAPVLRAATDDIGATLAEGFTRALILVTVEVIGGKGRFFVHLVAADPRGNLHAVEPSRELIEVTGKFVLEDAHAGNGRWRRLVASVRRTAKGATVEFELRG